MTKPRFELSSSQNIGNAVSYLLDISFIRFGSKLHREIVGIVFVLFCYEINFMMSLSDDKQGDIEAFNSTFRYLDDLLTIDNTYFDFDIVNFPFSDADIPRAPFLWSLNFSA